MFRIIITWKGSEVLNRTVSDATEAVLFFRSVRTEIADVEYNLFYIGA